MSITHVDPNGPGIRRRGAGTGFFYVGTDGRKVTSASVLRRIRSLAIPPAWTNVWISPEPRGHIQATGVDAAERRQYIYHDDWHRRRRAEKFERVLTLAEALPAARRRVTIDLRARRPDAAAPLAAAFRLLDLGGLRVGSRAYARIHGTYGVTTLEVRHATVDGQHLRLHFTGKGGQEWNLSLRDADLVRVLSPMLERDSHSTLLAYPLAQTWEPGATDFQRLSAQKVNDYIRDAAGEDFSAKDIRTWRATVVAAHALPWKSAGKSSFKERETLARTAVAETAEFLADTAAVTRRSYIDPRLIDEFLEGSRNEPPRTEREVRQLIAAHASAARP